MDCIDKILDFYNSREIHKVHEIKIQLGTILVELMKDLNNPGNLFRVQSCIILLINLFFDIEYPDHLHKKGKPISDLSEDELKIVNDLLRAELNCKLN